MKDKKQKRIISWAIILVFLLWGISWLLISTCLNDWKDRGTFGDMFGAVNSLFTGLAFAGLIYTIYLQREELERTDEELKNHKLQLEKQNENIAKQNFEMTFFNMLTNIQSITNNMVAPIGEKTGRIYLHELFENFHDSFDSDHKYQTVILTVDDTNKDHLKEIVIHKYDNLFNIHSYNLGHFYRTIHNLLKMIENYSNNIEIRRRYASILQAQLSNDELGFIFYNSLSIFSLDKNRVATFHRMVDDLNILENISGECIVHRILVNYFPNTNFFFTRKQS
jgi:hypothetical protein